MKPGRSLKLTKKLIADLELALAELPAKYAAARVGITERTYYSYIDRANEIQQALDDNEISESDLTAEDLLFLQFLQSVEIGKSKLETKLLNNWIQAASQFKNKDGELIPGDWKASKELLTRLNPKDFCDPNVRLQQTQQLPGEQQGGVIESPAIANPNDFAALAQQQQDQLAKNIAKQQQEE